MANVFRKKIKLVSALNAVDLQSFRLRKSFKIHQDMFSEMERGHTEVDIFISL